MKKTAHKNVSKALQQANYAVWSLHMSSQGRCDTEGHHNDAVKALKKALKLLKKPKED
jgi:hypothetical protein